jgi:uncharacterized membrane protein
MAQGFERLQSRGGGLATASFSCGIIGLVGAIVALVLFLISMFAPAEAARIPQEQMARSLLSMMFNIVTLCCGVIAVVLGAVATSRAKRQGAKPFARGRFGFYFGILALAVFFAMLVIGFVSFLLSIDEFTREYRDRRFALSIPLAGFRLLP